MLLLLLLLVCFCKDIIFNLSECYSLFVALSLYFQETLVLQIELSNKRVFVLFQAYIISLLVFLWSSRFSDIFLCKEAYTNQTCRNRQVLSENFVTRVVIFASYVLLQILQNVYRYTCKTVFSSFTAS